MIEILYGNFCVVHYENDGMGKKGGFNAYFTRGHHNSSAD